MTNLTFYKAGGLSRELGERVKGRIRDKRYLKGGECPSLLFYHCDETLAQKQFGKKRVYSHHLRMARQELKAGTETEISMEGCLQACSSWLT